MGWVENSHGARNNLTGPSIGGRGFVKQYRNSSGSRSPGFHSPRREIIHVLVDTELDVGER